LKAKEKISEYSEENLLRTFTESGDTLFLGELYRRYIPLVYGLCLKYLNQKEAAQDAVMDIFGVLADKVPQYEIKNFNTWLYSVAKNHCLHVLRKDKNISMVNIEDVLVENQAILTLTDKPQSQEEMEALAYCMDTLPEEQKRSINYFFYEEKSYADIVDLTGYALSKVKSYIQNGKRNLKSCMIKVLKLNPER